MTLFGIPPARGETRRGVRGRWAAPAAQTRSGAGLRRASSERRVFAKTKAACAPEAEDPLPGRQVSGDDDVVDDLHVVCSGGAAIASGQGRCAGDSIMMRRRAKLRPRDYGAVAANIVPSAAMFVPRAVKPATGTARRRGAAAGRVGQRFGGMGHSHGPQAPLQRQVASWSYWNLVGSQSGTSSHGGGNSRHWLPVREVSSGMGFLAQAEPFGSTAMLLCTVPE